MRPGTGILRKQKCSELAALLELERYLRSQLGCRPAQMRLAVIGIAALLAACGQTSADAGETPGGSERATSVDTEPRPRFRVCGVDRSGSYNFVPLGLDLCARLIIEARGGDVLVIRWISDASLRNEEFAARVEVPVTQLPDCENNPFNPRCQRERAAINARVNTLKRDAIQRILALRPDTAQRTDILGFIQAASDAYEHAPDGAVRELYMATDLLDNVRHTIAPDLRGVRVTVLAFQTDPNPLQTVALRKEWTEKLRRYGATEVTFHAAEVTP